MLLLVFIYLFIFNKVDASLVDMVQIQLGCQLGYQVSISVSIPVSIPLFCMMLITELKIKNTDLPVS